MSESAETITPETVTDEQVDHFFETGGSFSDSQPEVSKTPTETKTEQKEKQPEVADDSVKDEPKEEKKVNLGALHEERSRRKAEREGREAAERERDELKRQLQQFAQKQKEPSFDEDPVEALRRENDQIKQILIAQANKAVEHNENNAYWNRVKESELAFKQDKPDFDDAIKFLASSRLDELKDLGWSEQEASKVLADEIRWISDKAYSDEVNPAERFYSLAKRRGFKAEPVEEKVELSSEVNDKLDRIEKGIKTNRQLPPSSKSVKQDLTAEALADMNVDALSNLHGQTEFDKAWNKLFNA